MSLVKDNDVDTYAQNVTDRILYLANKHIPNKVVHIRKSDPPWLTKDINDIKCFFVCLSFFFFFFFFFCLFFFLSRKRNQTGKRKVQGVPLSQAAAHPRHEEEEETDKTKQVQIERTHEKHKD